MFRPDNDTARRRFRLQARIVFRLENGEFHSIESSQAIARPDPQITVTRLDHCLYRSLRQSISFPPDILMILRDRSGRIERRRGRDQTQKG